MDCYEQCKSEVAKMKPPAKMCSNDACKKVQEKIDKSCQARGWNTGTPFLLDLNGELCYCCCNCSGTETKIAVSDTEYRSIQDFNQNDIVFAADVDLNWRKVKVDFCCAMDGANTKMINVQWGEQEFEQITVSEDHLFLTRGLIGNVLVPASALQPNDSLIRPTGLTVQVTNAELVKPSRMIYQLATGGPKNVMEGHLFNTNGIVTADFALQASYIAGMLPGSFFVHDLDERLYENRAKYKAKKIFQD